MGTALRRRGGRLTWRAPASSNGTLSGHQATPTVPRLLAGLPTAAAPYDPRQPISKELKQLIAEQGYQEAFEQAIRRVGEQNIPDIEAIQTLDQFYFFIDALVTWIPGLRIWEWEGTIYHERTDYLHVMEFYYFFNQPSLLALQSPIDPMEGEVLTPLSLWLRRFAISWGEFLDTPESSAALETYKFAHEYAYQDYKGGEGGMGDYKTFNDWFARTFKAIDQQRPIAQPDDPRVVVFPAESTFVGQWSISTAVGEPMPAEPSIVVKHVEWPIPELLKDSAYGREFEGGIFIHSFLNIFDYHRQHAPASGRIIEAKFIPGQVYLEVELRDLDAQGQAEEDSSLPHAVIPHHHLEAQDQTGFQFVQCRGLFILQTAIGKIAVLPMGMAQVSSVAFVKPGSEELLRLSAEERKSLSYDQQVARINQRVQQEVVGKMIKKGDMITSFLFGGSDIVMLFERQSNINITATTGVHYPIRSQCAYANIATLLDIP